MCTIPAAAEPLARDLCIGMSRPTASRFLGLMLGALLARGRRNVTSMIWQVAGLVPGHFSSFHRVFSRARWSLWPMGRALAAHAVRLVPAREPVMVAVDDTVTRHRGPKIYGRGCHRDALRSSHRITSLCWGHRWVVMCVLVPLPLVSRRWALPVLCALYRPREVARREGRRFKTPCELAAQLAHVLLRWFPGRRLVFLGDGGFASFGLARSIQRRGGVLVARFYDDAAIYEPPTPPSPSRPRRRGRPPMKGKALPRPRQAAARTRGREATIGWYGGKSRRVAIVDGSGLWYRSGQGVVPLRWVMVHDREGTHRDEYLFSTDQAMAPRRIAEAYTGRWSIETTFQECNEHLGLQSPRCRVREAVLRTTPCLLGLYSVVALVFAAHVRRTGMGAERATTSSRPWYGKAEPTFVDALSLCRRLVDERIFSTPRLHAALQKIPAALRELLLVRMRQAA